MSAAYTLVPELRFSDFREDEEWDLIPVDELVKSVPTRNHQVPNSGIKKEGKYPVVDQGKELTAGHSDHEELLFRKLPVVVFGDHTTILKFIDFEFIVGADGTKLLHQRSNQDILKYIYYGVDRFKMGQDGYKRHFSILRKIQIPKPTPAEQQKIADCLGSLDDLIAAHRGKLDALQDHKKGLLQQLFPAEGETTPELRFLEFKGEWDQHIVSDIFDTATGGTPGRKNDNYWGGDVPWITTSLVDFSIITSAEQFITKEGVENSSARIFPVGTVLIAMYGQGKTRGQVALLGIQSATNQACAAILPNENAVPYFVFQNLANRYNELRSLSNDGGQKNLSQGLIRELPISLPGDIEEQQKIADCLSALDALITAQTEQLAALKAHKKGLMQKLFPNPERK